MWLRKVQLKNIRGFVELGPIELSQGINVFVGANNSGKSTIVRSIQQLQPFENNGDLGSFLTSHLRYGAESGEVVLELAEPTREQLRLSSKFDLRNWWPKLEISRNKGETHHLMKDPAGNLKPTQYPLCYQKEPNNFIYAYLSRRKPTAFQEQVTLANAQTIEQATQHLPSKIDRLSNPDSKNFTIFREACRDTLGFTISCVQSGNGKQAGLMLENGTILPVETMGEGTLNILVFLVHLALASGKLFLIEEIENDLHPKALKALLQFIVQKSESNQFIVSTHSNIVTRYLGSASKAKVFSVEMALDKESRIPVATCQEVSEKPEDRINLLENLGYELVDFYLWKGYLILEESTAERLIRDFFIPFMVPKLQGKLRTIASQGVSDAEPRLSDLMRLFVFIHTCPQYTGKAWVAVDGGKPGDELISRLKEKFKSWPDNHFKLFKAENFEKYYPAEFQERVSNVLEMPNGLEKQRAKGELVKAVLEWALANSARAQVEFKICAKEVLDFLEAIANKLV